MIDKYLTSYHLLLLQSRGFGHVEFENKSGVENALKKAGEHFEGRPIKVDVSASRGKREGFNRTTGGFSNAGGFNAGGYNARGYSAGGFGGNRPPRGGCKNSQLFLAYFLT